MERLPIFEHRSEIISSILDNQVTIVVGETGSGKTTRLPQFILETGIAGTIAVTEPRRIAVTETARFVAEHLDSPDLVGYQVRFDRQVSSKTRIKFMTDGILLRELQSDASLSRYSVVMVDEAHERSTNIDLVLGLLKSALAFDPDLRVVISSATIDAEKFSQYFGGAPIIRVSGRTYPVEVVWGDKDYFPGSDEVVRAIVQKVVDIHTTQPDGDVLVFMTGADDIGKVVDELEARTQMSGAVILPAHGALPAEDQRRIFDRFSGKRKVVVATNIAETSITVDGVVYVVDSGFIKQVHFHPNSGFQSLDGVEHSQAGCDQRAGRAGRTRPGVCYRLYTQRSYRARPEYTKPEILRSSLASVVLTMEDMGSIRDVRGFDFIDPPDRGAFDEAYATLEALGALRGGERGLAELGNRMAALPLDPRVSRMVLEAEKHGSVKEVVTIGAFLEARHVFTRPKGRKSEAKIAHDRFRVPSSDALTFLRVWDAYVESGFSRRWCYENFLSSRALWEVKRIRLQTLNILVDQGMELSSNGDHEVVMMSVAAGLIYDLFRKDDWDRYAYQGVFRSLGGVFIFPGSAVFHYSPAWFVTTGVVRTKKAYARGVSSVQPAWLPELAPSRFFFGEIRLTSYEEGDDVVRGVRAIMERRRDGLGVENKVKIGEQVVALTPNHARRVQQDWIRKARDNGWVKLTFSDSGFWQLVANHRGESYAPSSEHQVRDGEVWYCALRQSLGDINLALPQFQVFDLGEDEKGPEKSLGSSVSDMVASLRKAWG